MPTAPKKVINAWAMYDWANSAYNLVITSTIFPAYYDAITTTPDGGHKVQFLGRSFESASLYNYALAFAYLVIAILSPILSSIADYKGNKKSFMRFFCYLGSAACCSLFWFKADTLSLGIGSCILAAIGYCGSLVFYNAYLPEIAADADQDRVSAKGFSYGYIGSVLLQVICFVFVLAKPFGMNEGSASRFSFLLVGIWWISFAQITFRFLPKSTPSGTDREHNIFTNGFKELGKVWQQAKHMPVLKSYLFAFFFYSMGVQTVMLAATLFGSQVLQLSTSKLIACILIIQLVAIAGAYIMARLSDRFGNFRVLIFVVLIWIGICIGAYFITTEIQFYIIATLVGIVMGGIQSLSRSTYARIMPETKDTASFFSFYDVTEKLAIVIGMFSFGFIQEKTGNMRNSIIGLVVFFLAGAIALLITLQKQKQHTTVTA
ncbi:MFS transporter [Deminuibacter soli]|uniref:MFS transporter n=1 Tax=Deminuibacter soli TaxID=2291815 RepID=A0A3E1NPD3_9BACT|nr:MFS transporter [Deminuibacter soli]RFM29799.1 MFS transporter [Deminuibacter soli]